MQIFEVLNIFFIFSSFFSLRKNAMPACFDHPNNQKVFNVDKPLQAKRSTGCMTAQRHSGRACPTSLPNKVINEVFKIEN
jgi:hypothetical protein